MKDKNENTPFVPRTVPIKYIIEAVAKKYTLPKLYKAKDANGKPSVAPGKNWHVYYYFRNPETNKFDSKSKFIVKHGINRYKTVAERKAFGKNLIEVYTDLLKRDYNPYNKTKPDTEIILAQNLTTKEALDQALEQKKKNLSEGSIKDWNHRLKIFLQFADRQGFLHMPVKDVATRHVVSFLNHLENKKDGLGNKSINNFRACLSSLFTKLANDMIIDNNPVTIVHKRKVTPVKNKPFTPQQVAEIKKYFLENDPGMIYYLKFVAYAFLRPVDICRIKVRNVHYDNNYLTVNTKTEAATVLIIPQLKEALNKKELDAAGYDDFLITRNDKPGQWEANEQTKTKFFSDRFATMKKVFGYGKEYGPYSFRHSFALDLFNTFIKQGCTIAEAELKMLPITRHKSLSGLRNYLRDVGAMMPKDYGKDYTIDF